MGEEPVGENKLILKFLEELISGRKIPPRVKKVLRFLILIIWAAIIFLLFYQGWINRAKLIPILQNAEYYRIIPAVIFYLLNLIAAMAGWLLIIRTFDRSPGWWKDLQIFSITFAARRLPGTFWYIGGRMLMYQKIGVKKTSIILASAIELGMALLTSGVIGSGLLLIIGRKSSPSLAIAVILIILCGFILSHPRMIRIYLRKIGLHHSFEANTLDWLLWIFTFSIMWVMSGMMVVQFVKIVSPMATSDLLYVIGAWSLSALFGLLTFFLPSSFGATEFSLMAYLTKLLPLTLAGSVAFAIRLFTLLMEVLLAAAFYPVAVNYSREIKLNQKP